MNDTTDNPSKTFSPEDLAKARAALKTAHTGPAAIELIGDKSQGSAELMAGILAAEEQSNKGKKFTDAFNANVTGAASQVERLARKSNVPETAALSR